MRSRSRYVSVPILPLPKDRGTDRVAGGGSSNDGSPGWPGAGGGGAESWGVHPAHPNLSPPSLAAEARPSCRVQGRLLGPPFLLPCALGGRGKLIMQVGEVLSTHGLGLGFLSSFLGFMKRSEVWPERTVPMGWGSLFEYLWGFGIQKPGPGSSD